MKTQVTRGLGRCLALRPARAATGRLVAGRALQFPFSETHKEIIPLQLPRLPPVQDRLHNFRREQRQTQNSAHVGGAMPFARARSSSVACTPWSSIFRHRNALASALTMELSIRGRGAHGASQ